MGVAEPSPPLPAPSLSLSSLSFLKPHAGRCAFEDRGGVRERKPSFLSQIKWES